MNLNHGSIDSGNIFIVGSQKKLRKSVVAGRLLVTSVIETYVGRILRRRTSDEVFQHRLPVYGRVEHSSREKK